MNRFLRWWITYSVLGFIVYTIGRATGNWHGASSFGDIMLEIGIFASPLGAGIMWCAVRLLWWVFIDLLIGSILGAIGIKSKPKFPSFSKKSNIHMNDGAMGSQIGGSEYRIDNAGWVYETGVAGARVGRIDDEGLWKSERGDIIGRLDPDGTLREHQEGIMAGVLESQEGTGKDIGKAE